MNTWNLLQIFLFFFQTSTLFPFMGNILKQVNFKAVIHGTSFKCIM